MKTLQKAAIIIPLVALLAAPAFVMGQTTDLDPTAPIQDVDDIYDVLDTILGIVYTIFFVVAAFFILYSGFLYLTAAGNEDNLKKAKNQIIYAVIAIVIALIALGVDNIVASVVGGTAAS